MIYNIPLNRIYNISLNGIYNISLNEIHNIHRSFKKLIINIKEFNLKEFWVIKPILRGCFLTYSTETVIFKWEWFGNRLILVKAFIIIKIHFKSHCVANIAHFAGDRTLNILTFDTPLQKRKKKKKKTWSSTVNLNNILKLCSNWPIFTSVIGLK